MPRPYVFVALLLLVGCDDDSTVTVLVDLKTDLVAGVEFVTVRSRVLDASDRSRVFAMRETDVALGRDLTMGRRVAELDGLTPGTLVVNVALIDQTGREVIERDVIVTANTDTGITVLVTRDCIGVTCPATGDDPGLLACLGGRCVEPSCTPETPELCPTPQCTSSADCEAPTDVCAEAICEDGVCLDRALMDACAADSYCDPDRGCQPLAVDGGIATDGGTDAGTSCATLGACGTVVEVVGGDAHSCARFDSGPVVCWGRGENLGVGSDLVGPAPTLVAAVTDAVDLGAAVGTTCAALESGDILCWGTDVTGPGVLLDPTPLTGGLDALEVDVGDGFVCALTTTRTVQCTGANDSGQLGDPAFGGMSSNTAIEVAGLTDVLLLDVGGAHSCAARADGVYCWGANTQGQLGRGTTSASESMAGSVPTSNLAASLGLGGRHSCAIEDLSSQARCWGGNEVGQLGRGTTSTNESVPAVVPVSGMNQQIVAGRQFTCALGNTGAVQCWGLLRGVMTSSPAVVALAEVATSLGSGTEHACAVVAGEVFCWGENTEGQLGDGTTMPASGPQQVLGF